MRFKLYALSYKALSYAEIQKDLNKEIYKENKTEKRQRLEIVYENLRNSENARISSEFISADSFPRKQKKGGSGGISESEGRGGPPNSSPAEKPEKFQKKIFRNSADFAFPRRILTRKRKPRMDAFETIAKTLRRTVGEAALRRDSRIHSERL